MRLIALISAFAVLTFAGCGSEPEDPAAPKPVIVGTNPDYPPMQYIDAETGEMIGYEVDLMAAIAQEGGFAIEWKSVEWKGIFGALARNDIDAIMSAATITEERRKTYDFSEPYHTISQRMVVLTKDAASITAVEDLADKLIAVQMGTTGALLVAEKFPTWKTASFDNTSIAFADLAAGRVFGFMVDEPVAEAYGRANPELADTFTALPFQFSEEHYGIVLRKGDDELRGKINMGLKAVQEKGIDQKLREKWFQ